MWLIEVRQRDKLSIVLFKIVLARIVKASAIERTLKENTIRITAYADLALIAKNKRIVTKKFMKATFEAKKKDLK